MQSAQPSLPLPLSTHELLISSHVCCTQTTQPIATDCVCLRISFRDHSAHPSLSSHASHSQVSKRSQATEGIPREAPQLVIVEPPAGHKHRSDRTPSPRRHKRPSHTAAAYAVCTTISSYSSLIDALFQQSHMCCTQTTKPLVLTASA